MNVLNTHLEQLANMLIDQSIIYTATHFAHRHYLLIAQHAQLMRNGRIVAAKASGNIAHAKLASGSAKQRMHNL